MQNLPFIEIGHENDLIEDMDMLLTIFVYKVNDENHLLIENYYLYLDEQNKAVILYYQNGIGRVYFLEIEADDRGPSLSQVLQKMELNQMIVEQREQDNIPISRLNELHLYDTVNALNLHQQN